MDNNQAKPSSFIPDLCQLAETAMLVLLAALLGLIFTLVSLNPAQSFWQALGLNSLFVVWIALFCGSLICLSRRWLVNLSILQSVLLILTIVSIVTIASSLATLSLVFYIDIDFTDWNQLWRVGRNWLVAIIITLIWLRYLYLKQQTKNSLVAEGEARFRALQAKIQPHFLFNTLNTIASLISISPERAESTIERLADLMRGSLRKNSDDILLNEEIDLCKHYLAIEQERMGAKLAVTWQIDEAANNALIPPFTLQPLIENAVYHGIQQLPKGGEVKISINRIDEKVKLVIRNPVPESSHSSGNQIAQSNIKQRLNIRFDKIANMQTQNIENEYWVTLVIPYESGTNQ